MSSGDVYTLNLWSSDIFNNSSLSVIIIECLKKKLKWKYLLKLPVSLRISLTKFRVSNHKLPIEREADMKS